MSTAKICFKKLKLSDAVKEEITLSAINDHNGSYKNAVDELIELTMMDRIELVDQITKQGGIVDDYTQKQEKKDNEKTIDTKTIDERTDTKRVQHTDGSRTEERKVLGESGEAQGVGKKEYHPAIKAYADALVIDGGIAVDKEGRRNKSLNPDWYIENAFTVKTVDKKSELKQSPDVKTIKQAVQDNIDGKPLKKSQERILEALSEVANAEEELSKQQFNDEQKAFTRELNALIISGKGSSIEQYLIKSAEEGRIETYDDIVESQGDIEYAKTEANKRSVQISKETEQEELLTRESEQERRDREQQQKQKIKEDDKKTKKVEQKEQADKEVSNLEDELLGKGFSDDIFSNQGLKVEKSKQPKKEAKDSGIKFSKSTKDDVEIKAKKTTVKQDDVEFNSGKSVTFFYSHNPESATDIFGIPDKDSPYGRGYEPSGKYVTAISKKGMDAIDTQEYGQLTFNNPLVIDNDSLNWKKQLSESFNGKTGKELSKALIIAGYDGVVTTDKYSNGNIYVSEILDLTSFDESLAKFSRAVQPEVKNLAIVHNLTADNLEHADNIGGLAVPSIAVVNKDFPLSGFGEISLVGSKEQFSPGGATKIFDADIYSPRYPHTVNIIDNKAIEKAISKLSTEAKKISDNIINVQGLEDREGIKSLARSLPFQYEYLKSIGKEPNLRYEKPTKLERVLKKYINIDAYDLRQNEQYISDVVDAYNNDIKSKYSGKENLKLRLERLLITDKNSDEARNLASSKIYDLKAYVKEKKEGRPVDALAMDKIMRKRIKSKDFEKWLKDNYSDLIIDSKIFDGYTNSGTRKYLAHTLSNVVRIMKRELRGGESFNYGAASLRSQLTKQFKKISGIQADRDKIVSEKEMDSIKEESNTKYYELEQKLNEEITTYTRGGELLLEQVAKTGWRGIESEYGVISKELQNEVNEFLDLLKNYPTEYFEGKVQRAVDISEFDGAVVPLGKEYTESIEILKKHGITNIKRYKSGDAESRAKAVNGFKDLLFSKSQKQTTGSTVEQVKSWIPNRIIKAMGNSINVVQSVDNLNRLIPISNVFDAQSSGLDSTSDSFTMNSKFFANIFKRKAFLDEFDSIININSDSDTFLKPPKTIKSEPPSRKSRLKRMSSDIKVISNITRSSTFIKHGFSGLDTKTQRMMLNSMFRIGHNNKVMNTIVKLIPVDMMDMLAREKLTPQLLFNDKSMLKDSVFFNLGKRVSTSIDMSSALANITALSGAIEELGITLDELATINLDSGVAGMAINRYHGSRINPSALTVAKKLSRGIIGDIARSSSNLGITSGTINGRHDFTPDSNIMLNNEVVDAASLPNIIPPNIQGAYHNGVVYLVADNINKDNINSIISHESLHKSISENESLKKELTGIGSEFKKIIASIEGGNYKGRYKDIYNEALNRVKDADTREADITEEFIAYTVELFNKRPQSIPERLKRLIQKLISKIKLALRRAGIPVTKLTPADLTNLAMQATGLHKVVFKPKYKDSGNLLASLQTEGMPLFSYHGKKSKTANKQSLSNAVQMKEDGYGNEEIRFETGWFLNEMDNKWRYEMDDSQMDVSDEEIEKIKYNEKVSLTDLVKHDKLFKAYPELSKVKVSSKHMKGALAQFDDETNEIIVNRNYLNYKDILPKLILHETQHKIQDIEGFAIGGSPADFKQNKESSYEKLAGEIEARDSEDRLRMTPEERENHVPYQSQGIPQKDAIVMFGDKGTVKLSVTPKSGNVIDEFKRKAGLGPKKTLATTINDIIKKGFKGNIDAIKERWNEVKPYLEQGVFDKLLGIKLAEKEILGNVAHSTSGYISARLSTGSSSTMAALLQYGAPKWTKGIIQKKEGSKSFVGILKPVKDDLENFTAWMVAKRAKRLFKENKENNFSLDEINAGLALKKKDYQKVADDIAEMNKSVLDLAQEAGLVNAQSRKMFESNDYIPFYRLIEGKKLNPGMKKGFSHQSSGIRMLKGGEAILSDPLGNMIQNWAHLIDASMKNDALNKTINNLEGSRFIEARPSVDFKQAAIPKSQIKGLMKEAGLPDLIVDSMPSELTDGIANMWSIQKPSDPDVVRVMRNGKPEYYKVNDVMLLTSLTAVNQDRLGGIFRPMRYFKSLLTGAVTADPTFMARNWMRDSMHSWTIAEEKGFKFGLDSIHGAVKSFKEEGGYIDMMFAGASFQGGYGNYNNPDASRESMDAVLRKKGIKDIKGFKDSILDTPKKYWEMYRSIGDAIENANREAVLENSKKSGSEEAKYLFESKDIMDFSMGGSYTIVRALADMLPFFNARLIGIYRLSQAGKTSEAKRMIAAKGASIAMLSLALLAINSDNDDYEALEDWDKDQYWHFFFGDQHYRIPKPFELGLIFGTIPERSARALLGKDTLKEYAARMGHGASDTLAFNPVPQMFKPFVEVYSNKNMFTGRPIEGMGDKNKLPSARYNSFTSETMRALSDILPEELGASPKRLEHLMHGYLGAMGMYVLGASDMVVRGLSGMPPLPTRRTDRIPVIKAFYQEKPTMHTKYGTQFYDMLNEVNQIHSTINSYKKQGQFDKAKEIQDENIEKLRVRKSLTKSNKRLSKLRKRIDTIYRSDMDSKTKRARIDNIMKQFNDTVQNIVKRTHPYFR